MTMNKATDMEAATCNGEVTEGETMDATTSNDSSPRVLATNNNPVVLPSTVIRSTNSPHRKNNTETSRPQKFVTNSFENDVDKSSSRMNRACFFSIAIFLVGCAATSLLLGFGISEAKKEQQHRFDQVAGDLVSQFQKAFDDYLLGVLWLHQATVDRKMSHQEFRDIYEYMNESGIVQESIGVVRNVTHEERSQLENETASFFEKNYPEDNYTGFFGLEFNVETFQAAQGNRSEQSFYFPMRLVEPMELDVARGAIDLDFYSLPPHRKAIDDATQTGKPAMTSAFKLDPEIDGGDSYFVILFHPGIRLARMADGEGPRDLSFFTVPIKSLIKRAHNSLLRHQQLSLYLFDSTDSEVENPPFVGGAKLVPEDHSDHSNHSHQHDHVAFTPEENIATVYATHGKFKRTTKLALASREWTLVVTSDEAFFQPELSFLMFGAAMIFFACCCVALWLYSDVRRVEKMHKIQTAAKAEKAAILVESANRAHRKERELNDYLAHEVRNPLSAAISACSFVSCAVNQKEPLHDALNHKSVREDVGIIKNSLHFINDLLRSMLDFHRASSNQLKLELAPTDLLHDVFEPVASMLYRRGADFEVLADCPENLILMADRLRLKQIFLNLGRNSAKFVDKGFVRFRASVDENEKVSLYVEDSGPGIPANKRNHLFSKYQESLDSLSQGTGIGLSLCKSLCELMDGDVSLDDTYHSEIEGCLGTRFVIRFGSNMKPLCHNMVTAMAESELRLSKTLPKVRGLPNASESLPDSLSVLFVDDDMVLRKLFARAIRKVLPNWNVKEASNGETALRLVESETYDIIFLDMYMASTDKQLLGTETARALRSQGVKNCVICGLSANDLEGPFLAAGADCFVMKPFPVEKNALSQELSRILSSRSSRNTT